MIRAAPTLTLVLMIGPIVAGLAGAALPSFGFFPTLGGTALTVDPWRAFFDAPGIGRSILLSAWIGLAATAVSLVLVAGVLAACWGTRLLVFAERMLAPLLSVPHAAAALGLAFLIAPSGWLMRLVSPELTGFSRPPDLLIVHDPYGLAVILGLVVKEAPFLFLMALAALPQIEADRMLRIGSSFGYGRMAAFAHIVFPEVYRQIRLPVFAVLAFAASNVEVATILGPTTPPTLPVRLIDWLRDPDLSMRFVASAGALVQLALVAGSIALWTGAARLLGSVARAVRARGVRHARDRLARATGALFAVLVGFTAFASLAGIMLWSVAGTWRFPDAWPTTLTWRTWRARAGSLDDVSATTVTIALLSAVVASILAVLALEAEERRGRTLAIRTLPIVYLPLIVPQIVFLFGLDVLLLRLGVPATVATVVFVHLVFVLPYVLLALSDPWRAFDRRYADVARSLGAGETRILLRIRLPMLAAPLLVAFALGIAVSVGLYLPTLMIGAGRVTTVTTEAVALAASGDRRLIGVLVVLQMVIPLAAFTIARIVPRALFAGRSAGYGGSAKGTG